MGISVNLTKFFSRMIPLAILLNISSLVNLQAATTKFVSVGGECRLRVSTDRGQMTLTVENIDKDVAKATKKTNDQYNKLKKDLEKLKVDDLEITTSSYNVYERKEWESNKSVSKGFIASLSMVLESNKLDAFGDFIRVANINNVTNVSDFNTFLSLQKQKQLDLECLKVASKSAMEKAQTLAQELKGKLGGVLQINETQSFTPAPNPYPAPMGANMMKMDSEAATPPAPQITAGQTEYNKSITVNFELL